MNQKQKNRKRPLFKYQKGDFVYFHAFAKSNDESTYFMCRGCVVRQPKEKSNVYKIIVVAVDPKSVLCGERPDIAKILLGKKIARKQDQMFDKLDGLICKVYGEKSVWLQLSKSKQQKVLKYASNIKRTNREGEVRKI